MPILWWNSEEPADIFRSRLRVSRRYHLQRVEEVRRLPPVLSDFQRASVSPKDLLRRQSKGRTTFRWRRRRRRDGRSAVWGPRWVGEFICHFFNISTYLNQVCLSDCPFVNLSASTLTVCLFSFLWLRRVFLLLNFDNVFYSFHSKCSCFCEI